MVGAGLNCKQCVTYSAVYMCSSCCSLHSQGPTKVGLIAIVDELQLMNLLIKESVRETRGHMTIAA